VLGNIELRLDATASASGQLPDPCRRHWLPLRRGHRLRLVLASDDQDPNFPAMMTFRYASVGTSSLNRVAATSRLLLPLAAGKL